MPRSESDALNSYTEADLVRFWSKVEHSPGCWIWTGSTWTTGYGRFKVRGREVPAHRFSWFVRHGSIDPGLLVCHECDVPLCVRSDHLFLGTQSENLFDQGRKGRNIMQTHPELHPPSRGELNRNARLSARQVAEIRRRYSARESIQADLATEFGVTQGHISRIIRRANWSDDY